MIFTAIVNDDGNHHYSGNQQWSDDAYQHNCATMGSVELITTESKSYREMHRAARQAYGDANTWYVGTLVNYLAMLDFLERESDELMWIEADMVRNAKVELPDRFGICMTDVWDNPNYTPTRHERFKKHFCEAFIPSPARPYKHLMSSWLRLDRLTVARIIEALDSIGLNLFNAAAWERIRATELSVGSEDLHFFCDMVLELAWMASDNWDADNVFDLLGVVSYHDDYHTKPIIHFDGPNKPLITSWVAEQTSHILPGNFFGTP